MRASMKKQIWRIHNVFSHVGQWPFSFFRRSSQNFKDFISSKTLTASIEVAIFWSVDWVTSENPAIVFSVPF